MVREEEQMKRGKHVAINILDHVLQEESNLTRPLKEQAHKMPCRQPVSLTSNSHQLFKLIRHWLDFCLTHHFECADGLPEITYPTRLLELAREDGSEMLRHWTRHIAENKSRSPEPCVILPSVIVGGHQRIKSARGRLQLRRI